MHARVFRLIALILVILGASPFTAPFSTCDLGTLTQNDHANTAFKAPSDPHQQILLPTITVLAVPVLTRLTSSQHLGLDPIAKHRTTSAVLRI